MTSRLLLVCLWLLAYSANGLAETSQTDRTVSGKGVVINSEPGLIYVNGHEQRIINVQTETGAIRVFAPSMGTSAVSGGEKISFAGHIEKIDGMDVINTMTGYIYRQTAKSIQEQMMAQMQQMQRQQQQQMEKNPDVIPNAVPITMLETKEQKADSQLSLTLALLGVLLALLSLEKVPRLIHVLLIPIKAIASKIKSRDEE